MRNIVTWATAGVFALSLQGAVLAQAQEKAPEAMPPALESPTPIAGSGGRRTCKGGKKGVKENLTEEERQKGQKQKES